MGELAAADLYQRLAGTAPPGSPTPQPPDFALARESPPGRS